MALDVEVPDPPSLEAVDPNEYEDATVAGDTDYHREDIERFLQAGAWSAAFEEWAANTDVDETTYDICVDLDLFARYDFFWDAFADRVGYHAPGIPEDWKERDLHPDLDSWTRVSTINAALTQLGQTICDHLEADYVDWSEEYEPPSDLPDFE
jgi:hypothetical protein